MKKYWDTLDRGQRDGVIWAMAIVAVLWSMGIPIAVVEVAKIWGGCQ